MELYLALALGGIPLGAMYALSALGIVIVYKTSRVFNFATGAVGLACAYAASSLAGAGVPDLLTVPAAVALGVLLGAAIEVSLRPVRGALPRTIVTLGWLLLLQGAVGFIYGVNAAGQDFARPFGDSARLVLDSRVLLLSLEQLLVLLVAGGLAAGLALFFRRTALGTATRAVAEAPDAARLLGISVARVRLVAWGVGGGISGLAGVLVTPLLGKLDTTTLVIFTVQALAAALVGRLSSLPLTFAGGIALGMTQPLVGKVLADQGLNGANELTALLFVLGALLLFPRSGRKDVASGGLAPVPVLPLPSGATAAWIGVGVVGTALLLPLVVDGQGLFTRYNVAQTAAWSLAVLSLVLLVGVVGQVSLCQAVFMGIGAFGTAIATSHGVPFLLAMVLGGLLAALAATLVGLPAIRLEPLELAIATLSLAFTADRFLYTWPPLVSDEATRAVTRPGFAELRGADVVGGERAYAWLALAVLVLAACAVASMRRARTGAALTALRSSEPATAAMGFSVTSVKLRGFATSGFVAGLAGAVYAGLVGSASGAPFDFTRSITLLAYAVIVGVASVPGAVAGGAIVTLSTYSGSSADVADGSLVSLTTALTGGLLIAVLALAPEGVAGLVSRGKAALLRRGDPPEQPPAPATTEPVRVGA